MLQIKEITKVYKTGNKDFKALDNVSINFRKNEFVSILGQSGSGKSTLLNIIGGLDHYTSGDLSINNVSTKKYKNADWDIYRNNKIGFIFQNYNLIMHQSVLANVELALTLSGVSARERKKRAKNILEEVGLKEHIKKKPNQLSGGQMQRVAIARALVNEPEIILADEPTGALDSETSIQIMDILKKVAKDRLVIMVTHNPELAEKYSTRIIKLKDGKIEGDTNPFDEKEENIEETNIKKTMKKSMSFKTALGLSFKNLLTKKGRTILTAIAGSIGIVGIALVLALTNGVDQTIKDVESETINGTAITINDVNNITDFSIISDLNKQKEEKYTDKISSVSDIDHLIRTDLNGQYSRKNNMKDFGKYINDNKSELDKYSSNTQFLYKLDLQVYSKDTNGNIEKVNPSDQNNLFQSMSYNEDLFTQQYDLIAGKRPESNNELVLVVDKNNHIPLSVMYQLGLKDKAEFDKIKEQLATGKKVDIKQEVLDYNDILNKSYKLFLNTDYYQKNNGKWFDNSQSTQYIKELYDKSMELKIVGIAKVSDNDKTNATSGYIAYKNDLINYISSKIKETQIAKEQIEHKDTNILTGEPFDGVTTTYEINESKLGIIDLDKPSTINIYPKDVQGKNKIKEFIDNYNNKVDEKDKIQYTDSIESLFSGLSNIIKVISAVLIAIVAISLIVSSIMISIITYISVLERTKEIGILRAIGASKKDIKRVFRAETIIEGLISGILGVGVAYLITILVNIMLDALYHIRNIAVIPTSGAIVLILLSAVITLIAGIIPSNMASKRDPVESLKTE